MKKKSFERQFVELLVDNDKEEMYYVFAKYWKNIGLGGIELYNRCFNMGEDKSSYQNNLDRIYYNFVSRAIADTCDDDSVLSSYVRYFYYKDFYFARYLMKNSNGRISPSVCNLIVNEINNTRFNEIQSYDFSEELYAWDVINEKQYTSDYIDRYIDSIGKERIDYGYLECLEDGYRDNPGLLLSRIFGFDTERIVIDDDYFFDEIKDDKWIYKVSNCFKGRVKSSKDYGNITDCIRCYYDSLGKSEDEIGTIISSFLVDTCMVDGKLDKDTYKHAIKAMCDGYDSKYTYNMIREANDLTGEGIRPLMNNYDIFKSIDFNGKSGRNMVRKKSKFF